MKKTKIICTIGPASESMEVLEQLVHAGMNIIRCNFSHGGHDEQLVRIDRIKEVSKKLNKPIGILLDTKGPEIRIGSFASGKVTLVEGQQFTLTNEDKLGDNTEVFITYTELVKDVKPGNQILIDDGLIGLVVEDTQDGKIICRVQNGGELGNKKGVNCPGIRTNLPHITEKDKSDIIFGIENNISIVAASFVRSAEAVFQIREILKKYNAEHILIISKIENQEGLDNIDEIIEASDGIMVARGDLGVEIPYDQLPAVQKMIIKKCNSEGKPVIIATQMLDSMIRNPRPTRAEVTDVANAIYDGADAIMLSGETAMGKNPVNVVETMAKIAVSTEKSLDYSLMLKIRKADRDKSIPNAVAFSVCATSNNLGAKAIITASFNGYTARVVSKFRPEVPILAITPLEHIARKMTLYWGVYPIVLPMEAETDKVLQRSAEAAKDLGFVSKGDIVVISAGVPAGIAGSTNMMKVEVIQ